MIKSVRIEQIDPIWYLVEIGLFKDDPYIRDTISVKIRDRCMYVAWFDIHKGEYSFWTQGGAEYKNGDGDTCTIKIKDRQITVVSTSTKENKTILYTLPDYVYDILNSMYLELSRG